MMWCARRLSGLGVLVGLVLAFVIGGTEPAQALTYFNGPDGFGFDNTEGLDPKFELFDPDEFKTATQRKFNDGTADIVLAVEQDLNIKDDVFEVDVTWQIKNKTGETIDRVIVFFTALAGPPGFPDYSESDIQIFAEDGKELKIIRYDEGDEVFYFAGFSVRNIEPGRDGQRERRFRYVVQGSIVGGETPTMGVNAAFNPAIVPEPGTALLMALGFGGLAAWSRRPNHQKCD